METIFNQDNFVLISALPLQKFTWKNWIKKKCTGTKVAELWNICQNFLTEKNIVQFLVRRFFEKLNEEENKISA